MVIPVLHNQQMESYQATVKTRSNTAHVDDGCEDVILVENGDSCSTQSTDGVLSSYSEDEI